MKTIKIEPVKRTIKEIIIHCSATETKPGSRPITIADIRRWHKARGFSDVGYHYYIRLDGTIEVGRPLSLAGAHCKGHNAQSIGICYEGGILHGKPCDTRTPIQRARMLELILALLTLFDIKSIHGHNEFANKACPCYDVSKEYKRLNEILKMPGDSKEAAKSSLEYYYRCMTM